MSPLQGILKANARSYDITLAREINITALILQMGKLVYEGYMGGIVGTLPQCNVVITLSHTLNKLSEGGI